MTDGALFMTVVNSYLTRMVIYGYSCANDVVAANFI